VEVATVETALRIRRRPAATGTGWTAWKNHLLDHLNANLIPLCEESYQFFALAATLVRTWSYITGHFTKNQPVNWHHAD
jgi:hypothetical protein